MFEKFIFEIRMLSGKPMLIGEVLGITRVMLHRSGHVTLKKVTEELVDTSYRFVEPGASAEFVRFRSVATDDKTSTQVSTDSNSCRRNNKATVGTSCKPHNRSFFGILLSLK